MTTEEKQLLLKDLCARLPYGVEVQYKGNRYDLTEMHKDGRTYLGSYNSIYGDWHCCFEFETYPIPYLRPMSSMTEKENKEYHNLCYEEERECYEFGEWTTRIYFHDTIESIDWLLEHHFDFRDLIEKGLALEAPKGMYK